MAYRKLNLDWDKINRCRDSAARVVKPVQKYIDRHSTLSIESACLSLYGVEHILEKKPIANQVITRLDRDRMRRGISYWFGRALVHTGLNPRELGLKIAHGQSSFADIPEVPFDKIRSQLTKLAQEGMKKLEEAAKKREEAAKRFENIRHPSPLFMCTVSNDHEMRLMMKEELPDIIYISDSKKISQTHHTLKENTSHRKRFVLPVFGLESPKLAIQSIITGADFVAHDAFEEVLAGGINPKRAFTDAHWVRRLCARTNTHLYCAGIIARSLDAYRQAHQIFLVQMLMEHFAEKAGLDPEFFAVGHGFDIDPSQEEGFIHELARASVMRELYARNLTFYLPSKFLRDHPADRSKLEDLFNLCGIITEQSVMVVPRLIHHDYHHYCDEAKRALALVRYAKNIGDEIQFNQHGKLARRAHILLENTLKSFKKLETTGLLEALPQGFLGERKQPDKDVGLDGVFQKERDYYNPIEELLAQPAPESYCLLAEDASITPAAKMVADEGPKERSGRFSKGKRYKRHPKSHHKKGVPHKNRHYE